MITDKQRQRDYEYDGDYQSKSRYTEEQWNNILSSGQLSEEDIHLLKQIYSSYNHAATLLQLAFHNKTTEEDILSQVNAMGELLENKSAILALLIIFVFVTFFNFLVVSGSGKAVIIMPILQPLGKILHINQQVLVLTYQYGDGITNSFWPGSSLVQLSMCGVDYGSWIRFCWKIYLSFIVSAFILIMVAHGIGYGPF